MSQLINTHYVSSVECNGIQILERDRERSPNRERPRE